MTITSHPLEKLPVGGNTWIIDFELIFGGPLEQIYNSIYSRRPVAYRFSRDGDGRRNQEYAGSIFISLQKWLSGSISLSFIAITWTVAPSSITTGRTVERLPASDNLRELTVMVLAITLLLGSIEWVRYHIRTWTYDRRPVATDITETTTTGDDLINAEPAPFGASHSSDLAFICRANGGR